MRFIVDEDLKHGKFDIIAEAVAAHHRTAARRGDASLRAWLPLPRLAGTAPAQFPPRSAPSGWLRSSTADTTRTTLPWFPRSARQWRLRPVMIPKASTSPRPWNVDAYGQPQQPLIRAGRRDRLIHRLRRSTPSTAATSTRARQHPASTVLEAVDPFATAQLQPVRESPPAPLPERVWAPIAAALPRPAAATAGPAAHGRRNRRVRRRAASGDPMPAQAAVRPPHRHSRTTARTT